MQQETLLQKLERQARARKLEMFSTESLSWYKEKVRNLGGTFSRKALMDDAKKQKQLKTRPRPGYMYTYVYDAKHKDTLPYWDAFPLIIMIGPAAGGFYGINIHFVPPKLRALVFDKLIDITNNTKYDDKTKFVLTYKMLTAGQQHPVLKHCFRHYLTSQLGTKLAFIPASDWEKVIYMPTADFQKKSAAQIWSDITLKI